MIRRPPRSTLFPSRRSSDLSEVRQIEGTVAGSGNGGRGARGFKEAQGDGAEAEAGRLLEEAAAGGDGERIDGLTRSEEHTSELQSQSNLVCRLLLEKKKKTQ